MDLMMQTAFFDIQIDLTVKLLIAFVAGILIGFNRSYGGKPAGLRTQMLLCVGSALIAGVSIHMKDIFFYPESVVRIDPARLVAGVVSGIGFVGGGVILKSEKKILGVTTAATIWMSAAVGIAIGTGFYIPAFVAVGFVLLLDPLGQFERKVGLKDRSYSLSVDRKVWGPTQEILNSLNISYTLHKTRDDYIHITILSSQMSKNIMVDQMHEKRIKHRIHQIAG